MGWLPRSERLRRLTRALMGTIGTEAWHASPYVAAEVMLSLAESNGPELTVSDLAYGVSQLPHERLFPQLAPTAQKMVKALLVSDEPLTASELVEEAGVSKSSYEYHAPTLEAVGIIERSEGQWQAFIEPWWSPESPRERPSGDGVPRGTAWEDDMLWELAIAIDGADGGNEVFTRSATVEEIVEEVPELRAWVGVVRTAFGDPQEESESLRSVTFGTMSDHAQATL